MRTWWGKSPSKTPLSSTQPTLSPCSVKITSNSSSIHTARKFSSLGKHHHHKHNYKPRNGSFSTSECIISGNPSRLWKKKFNRFTWLPNNKNGSKGKSPLKTHTWDATGVLKTRDFSKITSTGRTPTLTYLISITARTTNLYASLKDCPTPKNSTNCWLEIRSFEKCFSISPTKTTTRSPPCSSASSYRKFLPEQSNTRTASNSLISWKSPQIFPSNSVSSILICGWFSIASNNLIAKLPRK